MSAHRNSHSLYAFPSHFGHECADAAAPQMLTPLGTSSCLLLGRKVARTNQFKARRRVGTDL